MIRHIFARGRVQGVGYRAFVEREALRLGLEGWVRNRRDGTVEALFSGNDTAVAQMIECCRRGPPAARVEAVEATEGGNELLAQRREGERFSMLRSV
jgi:acylphosphatase